jgi:hypothetical protein
VVSLIERSRVAIKIRVLLSLQIETFEKCSILFKVKEGDNLNPPVEINQRDRHQYL